MLVLPQEGNFSSCTLLHCRHRMLHKRRVHRARLRYAVRSQCPRSPPLHSKTPQPIGIKFDPGISNEGYLGILFTSFRPSLSVQLRSAQRWLRKEPKVHYTPEVVRVEQVRNCAAWPVHVTNGIQERRRRNDNCRFSRAS